MAGEDDHLGCLRRFGDRHPPMPERVAEPAYRPGEEEREKRQLIANLLVNAACREGMGARI